MIRRRKEIGSEFWDVPTAGAETGVFPASAGWFLSGRSALRSIIRELDGLRTAALPSWCCDSMIRPFLDAGMDVRFYPVYWDGGLFQELRTDCDALLVMDYFGYTGPAPQLSEYRGTVIRDLTHSLFSASCADADYSFGSLRKWCGVWTGGYAWAADGHTLPTGNDGGEGYAALREQAMRQKSRYIRAAAADKAYLQVFDAAEEVLDTVGIAPAADRDVSLALRLDAELIRSRRRANAEILRKAFPDWLVFPERKDSDCPMFVPILVPGGRREALRRHLIEQEIYCPVHWPVSAYHRLEPRERILYDNELSLVCDQRYTGEDMARLIETIRAFWKEA